MAHPFARLVPPLQYATRNGFEQLDKVKGLRALLESALAEGAGEPGAEALRRELPEVDHPDQERRKASLRRIAAVLGQTVQPGRRRGASESKAERVSSPRENSVHPERSPKGGVGGRSDLRPREKPRPAQAPRRRKAVGQAESRSEAKLLSIAPREGPLAAPLKSLGGRLSPRLVSALQRKGITRVGDVLFLLPRCYEDRRRLRTIAELVPGERAVTVGVVRMASDMPFRHRRRGFRAVIGDATGSLSVTYFQGGPWLKARFPVGKKLVISGELRATPSGREIAHPEIEPAEDLETSSVHFGRIVPIYPGFERSEQRAFRQLSDRVCRDFAHHLQEPLPEPMRERLGLMPLVESLRRIHFPEAEDDLEHLDAHRSPFHRRLAFDELFFLQLGMALERRGVKVEPGIAFNTSEARLSVAKSRLPFALTRAQARVVGEIAKDMASPAPMSRLLQGDVGSGKTAVAMVSAELALQDGYQVALMAPTEILAEQHARTFAKALGDREVSLFTSGGPAKARKAQRERLARGEIQVAVGTHALIQGDVAFARLGLVIVDEQHRFGVMQRHALMSKGVRPDVLVMTATPIPRTLAMTLYGDLDLSVIDELPPGRTPIETRSFTEKQRGRVYEILAKELSEGHQAYVVHPLIEESEKIDLADATQGAEKLQAAFPDHSVGLLHGQLDGAQKDAVMKAFRDGEIDILVCTTVVEVGVDVPNASVMVIESAERFGLSQLHQLRGRVGRGAAKSHCLLISGYPRSREASERLAVMEKTHDGFAIAEKDLELRGAGELLGTRQSGIPELAVANLARDQDLVALAQAEARRVITADPDLAKSEHAPLVRALEERWEGRLALAKVG